MDRQRKDQHSEGTAAGPSNINAEWLHFQNTIEADPFYPAGPGVGSNDLLGSHLYQQTAEPPFVPPLATSSNQLGFPQDMFSMLGASYPPTTGQPFLPDPMTSPLPWDQGIYYPQPPPYPPTSASYYIHPSVLTTPRSHAPNHSRSTSLPNTSPPPQFAQSPLRMDKYAKSVSPNPGQAGPSTSDARSPSSTISFEDDRERLSTEEKRLRNTQASARFRSRKKERIAKLDEAVTSLEQRASHLEQEATELRRENIWLKEMAILKAQARMGNDEGEGEGEEEPPRDDGND